MNTEPQKDSKTFAVTITSLPEPPTESKEITLLRLLLMLTSLRSVLKLRDEIRGGYNPELYALIDRIEELSRQLAQDET